MPSYPIPPKALTRLQQGNQNFLIAKAHYEDILNAVVEAMGIDTETTGIMVDITSGMIRTPDAEET